VRRSLNERGEIARRKRPGCCWSRCSTLVIPGVRVIPCYPPKVNRLSSRAEAGAPREAPVIAIEGARASPSLDFQLYRSS
jgi:hypothetical protein